MLKHFSPNLSRALFDRCKEWPIEDQRMQIISPDVLAEKVVRTMLETSGETDTVVREEVARGMQEVGLPYSLTLADVAIATVKRELRLA